MNIFMLGHSGVGKTTYMASMYGAMQVGVDKFSLASRYIRDHDGLVSLARDIQRGAYPPPTALKSSCDFYLKYDGRRFFPFTWSDYRGGALTERSNSEDARKLVRDLSKCDGILVFCDSEQAASRRGADRDIRRMTSLIGEALSQLKRPIPIGIVFTKYDLVEEIDEHMWASVEGLCQVVDASENFAGVVIPVACGSRPENIELPLLFLLYCGVALTHDALVEQMENGGRWRMAGERETIMLRRLTNIPYGTLLIAYSATRTVTARSKPMNELNKSGLNWNHLLSRASRLDNILKNGES